jgi:hypothetical protein
MRRTSVLFHHERILGPFAGRRIEATELVDVVEHRPHQVVAEPVLNRIVARLWTAHINRLAHSIDRPVTLSCIETPNAHYTHRHLVPQPAPLPFQRVT